MLPKAPGPYWAHLGRLHRVRRAPTRLRRWPLFSPPEPAARPPKQEGVGSRSRRPRAALGCHAILGVRPLRPREPSAQAGPRQLEVLRESFLQAMPPPAPPRVAQSTPKVAPLVAPFEKPNFIKSKETKTRSGPRKVTARSRRHWSAPRGRPRRRRSQRGATLNMASAGPGRGGARKRGRPQLLQKLEATPFLSPLHIALELRNPSLWEKRPEEAGGMFQNEKKGK